MVHSEESKERSGCGQTRPQIFISSFSSAQNLIPLFQEYWPKHFPQ